MSHSRQLQGLYPDQYSVDWVEFWLWYIPLLLLYFAFKFRRPLYRTIVRYYERRKK